MAIDPYSPCPGGLNKKVKFCCPDLVAELDKIQRMREGDQRQACLDYITHLEAKYPNRACLETTKALLQGQLGQVEQAQQTIESVLQAQPDNPVALAEAAMLLATSKGGRAAIPLLQRSLAVSDQQISPKVAEAFFVLAQALLAEGHVLAARAHLNWLVAVAPEEQQPIELMFGILSSPHISPLLKNEMRLVEPPPEVSWHAEFLTALGLAIRGQWLDAATRFGALSERVVAAPELWRNLAILRGWLADEKGAAAAFRRLATLNIGLDDAVEAEALALLLDPEPGDDMVEELLLTYTVKDYERVSAELAASRQTVAQPVHTPREGDEPPPAAIYFLVDRPPLEAATGISLEDMPIICGEAYLFGRQTDREARLEVVLTAPQRSQAESLLATIAPGGLELTSEQVVDHLPVVEQLLSVRWRPPEGIAREDLRRLMNEHRRRAVLETWPKTPLKRLSGRTPAEAAGDHSQRVRLLASVLQLELALDGIDAAEMMNELRGQLNLPLSGPIDPSTVKLFELPVTRYARLMVDKLSDEELIQLYEQALITAYRPARSKLGEEVVRRPSLDGKVDKAAVYGMLASVETDVRRAAERLEQARQAEQKAGRSCARWDLEAFALHLQLGEGKEATELLQHLQSRHSKEPGIRQALAQMLYQIGAIGPDGRPTAVPAQAAAGGIVVPGGAAAAESGGIWTPGGEAPGGKKSSLWVPGME